MKIVWTFIWSFLLSEMIMYVGGSMNGVAFNFKNGLIMTFIFTIVILLITTMIPNEPVEHHEH